MSLAVRPNLFPISFRGGHRYLVFPVFKPYHYVHDLALDSVSLREVCPWSALRGIYLN